MKSLIVFELGESGRYSARIGCFEIEIDGYIAHPDGAPDVSLTYSEWGEYVEVPCDYGDCPHALNDKYEKDADLCADECPSKKISEGIDSYGGEFPGRDFRKFVAENKDYFGHNQVWSADAKRMALSTWLIQGEVFAP